MKAKILGQIYSRFNIEDLIVYVGNILQDRGQYKAFSDMQFNYFNNKHLTEYDRQLLGWAIKQYEKAEFWKEWANKCQRMSAKLEQFELFRDEQTKEALEKYGKGYKDLVNDNIFNDGQVIIK